MSCTVATCEKIVRSLWPSRRSTASRLSRRRSRSAGDLRLEGLENRLALSVSTAFEPDDIATNDTLDEATAIVFTDGSAEVSATIGDGEHGELDVDIYEVTLSPGQVITVDVFAERDGSDLDSYLRLFDSDGEEVASNDDFSGLDSRLGLASESGGTFYVGVSGFDNDSYDPFEAGSGVDDASIGNYRLVLSVVDIEPNDTIDTATFVELTFEDEDGDSGFADVAGTIGDGDHDELDVDFYEIDVSAGQVLSIFITTFEDERLATARLFDSDGNEIDWNVVQESEDDSFGEFFTSLTAPAFDVDTTFFVGISGIGNDAYDPFDAGSGTEGLLGDYEVSFFVESEQEDDELDNEPNDTIDTATFVELTFFDDGNGEVGFADVSGTIGDGDHDELDVDFYQIDVSAGQVLSVYISNGGDQGLAVVQLFTSEGDLVPWASLETTHYDEFDFFEAFLRSPAFADDTTFFVGISGIGNDAYDPFVAGSGTEGLVGDYDVSFFVEFVNEAPTGVALTNTTPSLPENTSTTSRIKVADIVITDDALATNTIWLTGADTAAFEVSGTSLYLKAGVVLDFETKQFYSVTVSVADASLADNAPVTADFEFRLTDVNDLAPDFTSGTTGSVAENSVVTIPIYTATTTDADGTVANRAVTYSIKPGVGDATLVEILDPATGVVTLKAQANFEAKPTYTFTVVATNVGTGATLVTEQAVTVTVTDVNEAPTGIALSGNIIDENAGPNAVVGTLSTVDPDTGNTFTYTLVTGAGSTDNALFNISGNQLRATASLDFESKPSYTVRVRSTDQGGLSTEKQFTITVRDVNEAPTDITLSATSVAENNAVGAVVGTLSTVDPDAGDTFTYALVAGDGSADNAAFTIEGNQLRAARAFNFEARQTYSIRVRATDAAGLSTEKIFTMSVTDVADEPLLVQEFVAPAPGAYGSGARVRFTVVLSDVVEVRGRPEIQFRVGGRTRTATYVTGRGTPELTFELVLGRRANADVVTLGDRFVFGRRSAITAGTRTLGATLPPGIAGAVATGVRFDAVPPRVVGRVTAPPAGTVTVGQSLDFVVRFSEAVIVSGTPQIALTGLNTARQATFVAGSGTDALTFRYVVQAGDSLRRAGLGIGRAITLPGEATIADAAANRAPLRIQAPRLPGIVIDGASVASSGDVTGQMSAPSLRSRAAAFAQL